MHYSMIQEYSVLLKELSSILKIFQTTYCTLGQLTFLTISLFENVLRLEQTDIYKIMASPQKRKLFGSTETMEGRPTRQRLEKLRDTVNAIWGIYNSSWKPAMTLLNCKPPQAAAAGILLKEVNGQLNSHLHTLQYIASELLRCAEELEDIQFEAQLSVISLDSTDMEKAGSISLKQNDTAEVASHASTDTETAGASNTD